MREKISETNNKRGTRTSVVCYRESELDKRTRSLA